MFAPLVLVTLSCYMPFSLVGEPVWHKDYATARMHGMTANKPLVVIIGSGNRGWDSVSKDGALSKPVQRLLVESYICVYLDTYDEKSKQLAHEFEVESTGVVISNRDGSIQAFRHEGNISNDDLERYLDRYADPFFVARGTESPLQERTSYYHPGTGINFGIAPVCRT